MSHPWDQLADESAKAYAAFCHFYEQSPEGRSVEEAWRRYRVSINLSTHRRAAKFFWTWHNRFQWLDRAKAWDAHVRSEIRGRILEEREDMLRRQLKDLDGVREKLLAWFLEANLQRLSTQGLMMLLTNVFRLEREAAAELTQTLAEAGVLKRSEKVEAPEVYDPSEFSDPWLEGEEGEEGEELQA